MEIIGGREPKNLTIDSQASEMVTRSVSKARAGVFTDPIFVVLIGENISRVVFKT